MPKASPIQTSFNAGELSPQLKGRIDIEKYKNGCEIMENMVPQIHGPARKRAGSRFVAEVKDSTAVTKLVPFQFNEDQAYILEFGDQYIRFYKNGGVILSASVPYEISTPYLTADLQYIQFAQSADVMYIANRNHPPYKLGRVSDTNWTLTEVEFDWPPFQDENIDTTTITASAATGNITLTASVALFDSAQVGSYYRFAEVIASKYNQWKTGESITTNDYRIFDGRLYQATTTGTTGTRAPIHDEGNESDGTVSWDFIHDGAGYAEITSFTSSTLVNATVIKRLPESALSGTTKWSEGSWSDYRGWPRTVAFYEDRLWFAGSSFRPQTLWASTSGDYENHKYGTNDDDALNYTINSQEINIIQWISPGKVLAIGTSGSEFTASASSLNEAITPTNVRIAPQTTYGSSMIPPIKIGNAVIFIQRSTRKVREYTYNFETDAYVAPNMTVLAEHITQAGVADIAYQQEPDQIIWMPDNNGKLLGLTYERTEDVVGWHQHTLSGSVESVATIPHWDGDQDVTWLIVNRTINGATKRYIEYIEKYLTTSYATFSDSCLTYDGAPATVISGLDHLEGESVSILADGAIHPNRTVTSGSITLQAAASIVTIGLPYSATIKTMPLEAGAADGTSQGKTMRITNLTLRLHETGPGLWYGPNTATMDEYQFRETDDLMDNPVPLLTGDSRLIPWVNGYQTSPQITLQHRLPLPFTLVALMPQVVTNDR